MSTFGANIVFMKKVLAILVLLTVGLGANAQHRQDFRGGSSSSSSSRGNSGGSTEGGYSYSFTYDGDRSSSVGGSIGNFDFVADGLVQFDGAAFFGADDWMDELGNNALMRRGRLGLRGAIDDRWSGRVLFEYSSGSVKLRDALLAYKNGDFRIRGGNFKEDFSIDQCTSAGNLIALEAPMVVTALTPDRHLGVDVRWRHNWIYASAGTFFRKLGGPTLPEEAGVDQGMSYTGKLVFNPFWRSEDYGLHLGGGLSYRTPKTDGDAYDGFRYSSTNSSSVNLRAYLDTGPHSEVTTYEILWNAEFAGYWRGLRVQGEYIVMNNALKVGLPEPYDVIDTYSFGGWYAMASYLIFGGRQHYDASNAGFGAPSLGRSWGDIELVGRYDYLDLNDQDILGGTGQNFTFGVNYYVNPNVKFQLNYQYSHNDRYANGDGEYFIGFDADGIPTKEPADVVGTAGIAYHMVGLRMQVSF